MAAGARCRAVHFDGPESCAHCPISRPLANENGQTHSSAVCDRYAGTVQSCGRTCTPGTRSTARTPAPPPRPAGCSARPRRRSTPWTARTRVTRRNRGYQTRSGRTAAARTPFSGRTAPARPAGRQGRGSGRRSGTWDAEASGGGFCPSGGGRRTCERGARSAGKGGEVSGRALGAGASGDGSCPSAAGRRTWGGGARSTGERDEVGSAHWQFPRGAEPKPRAARLLPRSGLCAAQRKRAQKGAAGLAARLHRAGSSTRSPDYGRT